MTMNVGPLAIIVGLGGCAVLAVAAVAVVWAIMNDRKTRS